MSELVLLGLKFAFLAMLWLFILFAGQVIRTDLFGRRAPTPEPVSLQPRQSRRQRKAAKSLPLALRITQGKQAGLTMVLGESLKIGRSPDCQLILDDDYVSTRHARIYASPSGYMVEDLGSTNGTYMNNERISSPCPFTSTDTLRIGRTLMIVEA